MWSWFHLFPLRLFFSCTCRITGPVWHIHSLSTTLMDANVYSSGVHTVLTSCTLLLSACANTCGCICTWRLRTLLWMQSRDFLAEQQLILNHSTVKGNMCHLKLLQCIYMWLRRARRDSDRRVLDAVANKDKEVHLRKASSCRTDTWSLQPSGNSSLTSATKTQSVADGTIPLYCAADPETVRSKVTRSTKPASLWRSNTHTHTHTGILKRALRLHKSRISDMRPVVSCDHSQVKYSAIIQQIRDSVRPGWGWGRALDIHSF